MEIKLIIGLDEDTKSIAKWGLQLWERKLDSESKTTDGADVAPTGDTTPKKAVKPVKTAATPTGKELPAESIKKPLTPAVEPTGDTESERVYEPEEVRAMLVEVKHKYGIEKCKELLNKYKAVGSIFTGLDKAHYAALAADIDALIGG